jgi:hypothetical protein
VWKHAEWQGIRMAQMRRECCMNSSANITMRGKRRQVRAFVKVSEVVLHQILRCVHTARGWIRARAPTFVSS